MKTDTIYWVWMQYLFGIGTRRAAVLMDYAEHPREIYCGICAGNHFRSMLELPELTAVETAMNQAQACERRISRLGCEIITPDHPSYPPLLRSVYGKPLALYCKGDLSCLQDTIVIAMVGTRTLTENGKRAAADIAGGLARNGAVVVSGLAAGIDTESHAAALAAGGQTVGVLGCGIDVDYPAGSAPLKTAMSRQGAVVTEYPPGYPIRRGNFPWRNRIISGMAQGTVVVEADLRSGSLITARLAREQGRDVFAVPGSPGSNQAIKDGARLIDGVQDILAAYEHLPRRRLPAGRNVVVPLEPCLPVTRHRTRQKVSHSVQETQQVMPKQPASSKTMPEDLTETAAIVYTACAQETLSVDELVERVGHPVGEILTALTELEIYGLIDALPGRRFRTADQ